MGVDVYTAMHQLTQKIDMLILTRRRQQNVKKIRSEPYRYSLQWSFVNRIILWNLFMEGSQGKRQPVLQVQST